MAKKNKNLAKKKSNASDQGTPRTSEPLENAATAEEVTPAKDAHAPPPEGTVCVSTPHPHFSSTPHQTTEAFFTPAPVPPTPGAMTPSTAAHAPDAHIRELQELKEHLAQRDATIQQLQGQLAHRDAEVQLLRAQLATSGGAVHDQSTTMPSAATAGTPEAIAGLQERLAKLKEEQAKADAARAQAWAELRNCVADISKLANPNHTPVAS